MERTIRFSIRNKLLLFMIPTAVIPIMLLGSVIVFLFHQHEMTQTMESYSLQARLAGEWVNASLAQAEDTVEAVARARLLKSFFRPQQLSVPLPFTPEGTPITPSIILGNFLQNYSGFRAAFIARHDGELIANQVSGSLPRPIRRTNFSFRAWYPEVALTAQTCMGDVFIPSEGGLPMVSIVTPVLAPDGSLDGFFGGILVLSVFLEALDSLGLPEYSEAFLVDSRGIVVAHSQKESAEINTYKGNLKAVQSALAGRSTSAVYRIAGRDFLMVSTPVGSASNWGLVIQMPVKEAFASLQLLRNIFLVAALAAAFVALVIGFFLASSLTRPLKELRQGAQLLATGNLSHRIHVKSHDEVGEFADTFNQMTEKLKQSSDKLISYNRELQRRNEGLDEFVYSVSHDLKAPLRAIYGFANMLTARYGSCLDADGKHFVERIAANATEMDELVRGFLELARVELTSAPYEQVDSAEVVSEVLKELEYQIKQAGTAFEIQTDLPTIEFPRLRLHQILVNLIDNAVKYSAQVESPKVWIGHMEDVDEYAFYVRDNGVGISPRHHQRIFRMFQRLQVKDIEKGTGIGLAVVKRIVAKYGGKIWVDSELGQGSTFYFTLPKRMHILAAEVVGVDRA